MNGLEPGTTYVFRLVATNARGTVRGVEQTFATTTAPGKPTAQHGLGVERARDDRDARRVGRPERQRHPYWFVYGTTAAADIEDRGRRRRRDLGRDPGLGAVKGLKPDTSYLFRLVATNTDGTSTGVAQVVTTPHEVLRPDARRRSPRPSRPSTPAGGRRSSRPSQPRPDAGDDRESSTPSSADDRPGRGDRRSGRGDGRRRPEGARRDDAAGPDRRDGHGSELLGRGHRRRDGILRSAATARARAPARRKQRSRRGQGASTRRRHRRRSSRSHSLDQLEIVAGFAEADAAHLAVGQPATITFPALPNDEVAGKVVAVSSTSTVVSNVVTYDVTISLIKPPSEVKVGMTANVSVVTSRGATTLELPSAAITTTGRSRPSSCSRTARRRRRRSRSGSSAARRRRSSAG